MPILFNWNKGWPPSNIVDKNKPIRSFEILWNHMPKLLFMLPYCVPNIQSTLSIILVNIFCHEINTHSWITSMVKWFSLPYSIKTCFSCICISKHYYFVPCHSFFLWLFLNNYFLLLLLYYWTLAHTQKLLYFTHSLLSIRYSDIINLNLWDFCQFKTFWFKVHQMLIKMYNLSFYESIKLSDESDHHFLN